MAYSRVEVWHLRRYNRHGPLMRETAHIKHIHQLHSLIVFGQNPWQ
jgi:hypothetical protein